MATRPGVLNAVFVNVGIAKGKTPGCWEGRPDPGRHTLEFKSPWSKEHRNTDRSNINVDVARMSGDVRHPVSLENSHECIG